MVKKVEAFSSEMSEEAKNKWITQLKKAHQLCEEGKEEEAKAILSELRKEGDWDTVFSTHDGN
jgi:soluble cytochrome b562